MTAAPPSPAGTPPDRLLPVPPFPPVRRRAGARALAARTWRRTWPWFAALAVVVVVVVAETVLLQGRIRADLARLREAADVPRPARTVTDRPLPAVPVLAPAAAGDVAAVRLRLLAPPCAPASDCTVLVAVERTAPTPTSPTPWSVLAVDRCTGTVVPLGSGVTPAAPGSYGIATVVPPPGGAPALVAVTTGPARVASPALPLGTGPC